MKITDIRPATALTEELVPSVDLPIFDLSFPLLMLGDNLVGEIKSDLGIDLEERCGSVFVNVERDEVTLHLRDADITPAQVTRIKDYFDKRFSEDVSIVPAEDRRNVKLKEELVPQVRYKISDYWLPDSVSGCIAARFIDKINAELGLEIDERCGSYDVEFLQDVADTGTYLILNDVDLPTSMIRRLRSMSYKASYDKILEAAMLAALVANKEGPST